jgi:hypothetical protein
MQSANVEEVARVTSGAAHVNLAGRATNSRYREARSTAANPARRGKRSPDRRRSSWRRRRSQGRGQQVRTQRGHWVLGTAALTHGLHVAPRGIHARAHLWIEWVGRRDRDEGGSASVPRFGDARNPRSVGSGGRTPLGGPGNNKECQAGPAHTTFPLIAAAPGSKSAQAIVATARCGRTL